jgi:hypothetical protein
MVKATTKIMLKVGVQEPGDVEEQGGSSDGH